MNYFLVRNRKAIYALLVFILLISACSQGKMVEPATGTPTLVATEFTPPTSAPTITKTLVPPTPSVTSTATLIPTATATPLPTPLPIPSQPITEENASGLQQWYSLQGGAFSKTVWAPDGKSLWIIGARSLDRYDPLTNSLLDHITFPYNLYSLAVSKHGSYLALVGGNRTNYILTIWNIAEHEEIHRWEDTHDIHHFCFSSDESRFVYLTRANPNDPVQLTVWNIPQGKLAYTLQLSTRVRIPSNLARLAISPDNQAVAVSYQNRITFWSLDKGDLLEEFQPDSYAELEDLAFSKDSAYMIVSTNLGNIFLLDRKTGKFTRKLLAEYADTPRPITFSPDGRYVLAVVGFRFIKIWDLENSSDKSVSIPRNTFESMDRYIYDASYSPDGSLITISTNTYRFYLLDSLSFSRRGVIPSVGYINSLAVSLDAQYLAYGGSGETDIHFWSFATQKEITTIPCSKLGVGKLYFPKAGNQLITTCGDGKNFVWDIEDFKIISEWQANGALYEIGIAEDGKEIALVDRAGPQVFQTEEKKYLRLDGVGKDGSYSNPAISPDGSTAVFVWTNRRDSSKVEIRMWDTESRKRTKTIRGFIPTSKIIFSPDGKRIAVGTRGKFITIWSAANGGLIFSLPGHTQDISVIAFSPDGSLLASADASGTLHIWSMKTGQAVAVIKDQPIISSLVFTPGGDLLIGGGADGTINMWGILP